MLFSKTALFSLLAGAASAAPVPEEAQSMVAAVPQWTIANFKRTCNGADTSCTVQFAVDTHLAAPTPCSYVVNAASRASRATTSDITCGPYKVSSGWDGSWGEGNGFTTWAVVDFGNRLIVWPAYTDKQLVNGQVVKPDLSFQPQSISW
ncbi:hypothetical protein RB601_006796 [Gaeumannomyces tritici]